MTPLSFEQPFHASKGLLSLAFGALALSSVPAFAQKAMFSVKALTVPSGYTQAVATSINNAGDVVGVVSPSVTLSPQYAVIWQNGTPTLLGTVTGATSSTPVSINNADQVAGNARTSSGNQAVIWNNGTPTLLPTPYAQYSQTFTSFLNDAGQVVGYAQSNTGAQLAIVWNGTTPTTISLEGNQHGEAMGINAGGLIAGNIANQAVTWSGTTPTALAKFSVPNPGGDALAVNSSGIVVGKATTPASGSHENAAAWANGVITDLGTLQWQSFAAAVNTQGIIVGQSNLNNNANGHAVLWSRIGAPIQDLNNLISSTAASQIHLTGAYAINDSCTIVAGGYTREKKTAEALLLILNNPANCVNGLGETQ